MAHATLHFTLGMLAGSAVAAPPLMAAWYRGRALASPFRRWFLIAYAAGTFAVFPAILRRLGASEAFCAGPWMNLFLFHPWITQAKPGAETMGPLLLGTLLAMQYGTLILALLWRRYHPLHPDGDYPRAT